MEAIIIPIKTNKLILQTWVSMVTLCFLHGVATVTTPLPMLISSNPLAGVHSLSRGRLVAVTEGATCGHGGIKQALLPTIQNNAITWSSRDCITPSFCGRKHPQQFINITLIKYSLTDTVDLGGKWPCEGNNTFVKTGGSPCYVNITKRYSDMETFSFGLKLNNNNATKER